MSDGATRPFSLDTLLPDFSLTVGENAYNLRYDFAAFRTYQKTTGDSPFVEAFKISLDNLDSFLWAGLQPRHPGLTLDQVRSWITPKNTRQLLDFVGEAYNAAFPEPNPEAGAGDPPKA